MTETMTPAPQAPHTAQSLFDRVARHLLTQGQQAFNPTVAVCMYRHKLDSGLMLKCGIGGIIPDDQYNTKFEMTTVQPLDTEENWDIGADICVAASIPPEHRELAWELQKVHDNRVETGDPLTGVWKMRLREVARNWELSATVLDAF